MRESGQDILVKIKQRWQMKLWADVLFDALGAAILTWFLFHWLLLSILAFAITGFLFALLKNEKLKLIPKGIKYTLTLFH